MPATRLVSDGKQLSYVTLVFHQLLCETLLYNLEKSMTEQHGDSFTATAS